MSLGLRYRVGCDGCGRNVFVPRTRMRINEAGIPVPVGDVLCRECRTRDAAGVPLRYDA